jgi:predicted nuclease of predicted toxin-antitoxin system
MRFLVDAQLPPALAGWLSAHGHDGEHVFDRFPSNVPDSVIWQHAVSTGAVIVSKDQDFVTRVLATETGPSVIWLRLGNTSRGALLSWLDAQWPTIENALKRGERLVEVT